MDDSARTQELEAFFARYDSSLERFAPDEIADCYGLPCLVLADEGSVLLADRQRVVDAFSAAAGLYRQYGFAKALPRVVSASATNDRITTADVNWAYLTDCGQGSWGGR